MSRAINPDSGGGGGGGGITGGGSHTGSGGIASSFVPFLENGGFPATAYFLFVPVQSAFGGNSYIAVFASSNFDDPNDASYYTYRQEDVTVGRLPVVRRIIVVYRDLGPATITVSVSGTDDNGVLQTSSKVLKIGSTAATSNLITAFADVQLSAFRPQIRIDRAAGAGPVSIISVTMIGEVDEASL